MWLIIMLIILQQEDNVLRTFESLDEDSSGTIDVRELKTALEKMGYLTRDVNELILSADANGDGVIDFQEFSALLRNQTNELQNR